jgi:hypothetical protein
MRRVGEFYRPYLTTTRRPPVASHDRWRRRTFQDLSKKALLRIFVSHSPVDWAACDALVQALRRDGADMWYEDDRLDIARDLEVIERELRACPVFLVPRRSAARFGDSEAHCLVVNQGSGRSWNMSTRTSARLGPCGVLRFSHVPCCLVQARTRASGGLAYSIRQAIVTSPPEPS